MHAVRDVAMSRNALDIGTVVREHYESVYRFCARRVGMESASDAVQETFVTAHNSLRNFRGGSALRTWLFGIAHNHCRRIVRDRKIAGPTVELDDSVGALGGSEDALVNRSALKDALSKLSPEHREVVLLHEVEGLSYDEAAKVLGVPAGTVKSRLHHAFLNLRKTLESAMEPHDLGDNR